MHWPFTSTMARVLTSKQARQLRSYTLNYLRYSSDSVSISQAGHDVMREGCLTSSRSFDKLRSKMICTQAHENISAVNNPCKQKR